MPGRVDAGEREGGLGCGGFGKHQREMVVSRKYTSMQQQRSGSGSNDAAGCGVGSVAAFSANVPQCSPSIVGHGSTAGHLSPVLCSWLLLKFVCPPFGPSRTLPPTSTSTSAMLSLPPSNH